MRVGKKPTKGIGRIDTLNKQKRYQHSILKYHYS